MLTSPFPSLIYKFERIARGMNLHNPSQLIRSLNCFSSDVVVAQSAFNFLRLGRSSQFIVARLLHFWNSKNIKKHGELMGIILLFLDEKVLYRQASYV
ncbi:hypothetical protein N665_0328s0018 [Sinapis alba]|nr:hypothetical protein N665_0328s0018 [Sinapis alba]